MDTTKKKKVIHFKVATPEKVVYADDIESVTLNTQSGYITILPDHTDLVSILAPGEMVIRKGDHEVVMAVGGGFLEMRPGSHLVVLADAADTVTDLDLEAIKAAKERAEKIVKEHSKEDRVDFALAEEQLLKELSRLKIAEKYRPRL